MDYRSSYRPYDRSGPPAADSYPIDDPYDRSRKRGRSPSPSYYRDQRRTSNYNDYPPLDPWDRPPRDYRDASPYASRQSAYDNYRPSDPYEDRTDRTRAAEWDRYYREREREREPRDHDYRSSAYDDRDRYDVRSRYDEPPPSDRDDRPRHRDRQRPYLAYDSQYRRDEPPHASDSLSKPPFDPQPAPDPMQSDSLLQFRQYAQMTKAAHPSARDRSIEQPTTQELYDGYQAYKSAFNKKAIASFFEQRKHEAWFKEKYSPAEPWLTARNQRKRTARAGKKFAWLQELQQGKLDKLTNDIQRIDASDATRDTWHPEDADDHHRGRSEPNDITLLSRYGEPQLMHAEQAVIPACNHQMLVKTFPADLARERLEEVLASTPGFRYLALGEPHVGKRWHRAGWAMYEPHIDIQDTLNALQGKDVDGFALNLAPCTKPTSSKLRTVPVYANSFHRLLIDLKHCKQLVERFEIEDRQVLFRDQAQGDTSSDASSWLHVSASEAISQRVGQIEPELVDRDLEREFDAQEDAEKREQRRRAIKKLLDLHLDLLRTVYHCDYYISLVCESEEELLRRSPRHARRQPSVGVLVEEPRENSNDESWARSVDQKTSLMLADDKTDLTEMGGKDMTAELMSAALPYIKEEDKEKHRCTVTLNDVQCGKLFKAAIFVQKHILNKHRTFIESVADEVLQEVKFFNNYVRDPSRAISQPSVNAKESLGGGAALAQRLDGGDHGAIAGAMFNSGGRMGMIRFGSASVVDSPRRAAHGGSAAAGSLGMRLGGVIATSDSPAATPIKPDPLPPPPKPLDPRAQRAAPKSYQDLDGAAEGDVDLAY